MFDVVLFVDCAALAKNFEQQVPDLWFCARALGDRPVQGG